MNIVKIALVFSWIHFVSIAYSQDITEYYSNGNIKSKGQFDSNNLKTGTWIILDSVTQDTTYLVNYVKGKLNGSFFIYYTGTNRKSKFYTSQLNNYSDWQEELFKGEGTYKQDSLDGSYVEYFANGKIRLKEYYNFGTKIGKHIEYHDNGNIAFEKNYTDGVLDSVWSQYYNTGKLREEILYNKGEKQSVIINEWFDNGKLMNTTSYVYINCERTLNGPTLEYYESGNVKHRSYYTNGKPDGIWEGFDENGLKKYKMIYKNCIYQSYVQYHKEGEK